VSYVGQRKGMRVCTVVNPPKFPSRWCRFTGHNWTRRRYPGYEHPEWDTCDRCGAERKWVDADCLEASEAMAASGSEGGDDA
jgi:hypothetical protein